MEMPEKDTRTLESSLQITPQKEKQKIINILNSQNIYYIDDLCENSRIALKSIPGLGRVAINRIELALHSINKKLGKPSVISKKTGTTMVRVRVNEKIKAQAAETLSSLGLTVSDAVRVLLTRIVAHKELPLAVKAANEASRAAIAEALLNDLEIADHK